MTEYERARRRENVEYLLHWGRMQTPAYSPLQALVRLRGLLAEVHEEAHNAVAALRYVWTVTYYAKTDDVSVLLRQGAREPSNVLDRTAILAAEAQPAAHQQALPY